MRLVCLFLLSFLFYSCIQIREKVSEVDYTGFTERQLSIIGFGSSGEAKDTLASLTLKLPQRIDTFYQWLDYQCCSSCGFLKYRFADSRYPQYAESGFFYSVHPDSNYQLSIWNRPSRSILDSTDLRPVSLKSFQDDLKGLEHYACAGIADTPFLVEQFKYINGRSFAIAAFSSKSGAFTWKPSLYVTAKTNLKSRELIFIGECCGKDTSGFTNKMYNAILSIKIKERD